MVLGFLGRKNKTLKTIIVKDTGITSIPEPPQVAVSHMLRAILYDYGIPLWYLKPFVFPTIKKRGKTKWMTEYTKKIVIEAKGHYFSPYTWIIGIGERRFVKPLLEEYKVKTISGVHGDHVGRAVVNFSRILNNHDTVMYIVGEIPTHEVHVISSVIRRNWRPEWTGKKGAVPVKQATIPHGKQVVDAMEKLEYDYLVEYLDGKEVGEALPEDEYGEFGEIDYLSIIADKRLITFFYICNLPRKLMETDPLIAREEQEPIPEKTEEKPVVQTENEPRTEA